MYILYESPRLESTHLAHIVHWGNKLVGKFRSTTALVLGYHRGFVPTKVLFRYYLCRTYLQSISLSIDHRDPKSPSGHIPSLYSSGPSLFGESCSVRQAYTITQLSKY